MFFNTNKKINSETFEKFSNLGDENNIYEIFKIFDKDKSKKLEKREFKEMLNYLKKELKSEKVDINKRKYVEMFIVFMETDEDSIITVEEIKFFHNNYQSMDTEDSKEKDPKKKKGKDFKEFMKNLKLNKEKKQEVNKIK
jgi:hypothetical protein